VSLHRHKSSNSPTEKETQLKKERKWYKHWHKGLRQKNLASKEGNIKQL
jgi:hypothetical protein